MPSNVGMRPGAELAGKVALVTGAARNIGRAIARSLAAGGAAVMVNAKTSRAEAEKTVAMIESAGGKAALHIADITNPKEVNALVEATMTRFGRLDFLVNNAAVRFETPFEKMKFEEWRQVLAIVLDGAFLCAQAALPHLIRAGGGTIINIGGQTGHKGASERAHVITAKAGLAGMTKALALDLAPHRITVNCVVPGAIESQSGLPGVPERPADRRAPPPIGRRGEPEEIAAMVRMLCGPDARYITGQAIHVNGGGYLG
jgi:3-oxoacyl-[acyl-carrier protein] reductase